MGKGGHSYWSPEGPSPSPSGVSHFETGEPSPGPWSALQGRGSGSTDSQSRCSCPLDISHWLNLTGSQSPGAPVHLLHPCLPHQQPELKKDWVENLEEQMDELAEFANQIREACKTEHPLHINKCVSNLFPPLLHYYYYLKKVKYSLP